MDYPLIALIDLDGTVADFSGAMARDLNAIRGEEPPFNADTLWEREKLNPYIKARMALIKKQPGWWRDLDVIPSGMEVVDIMRELGYELHVLTKGPEKTTAAWTEKVDWVQEHLPDASPTITFTKSLVYGRVLFDDFEGYMDDWLRARPRGLGIMPVNATNRDYRHERVVRFRGDNIDDIRDALKIAAARRPGEPLHVERAVALSEDGL